MTGGKEKEVKQRGERKKRTENEEWTHVRKRDRRSEGEAESMSLTTKRGFTDRCTYVHQHVRDEKGTGIIHYDSSFRNNNEALRRHALLRRGILHLGHVAACEHQRDEKARLIKTRFSVVLDTSYILKKYFADPVRILNVYRMYRCFFVSAKKL